MDMNVLQEFQALTKSLNYSTTAKQRFVSKSAISKHIQQLEKELDVQLFVRDGKTISLTPQGEMFLKRANVILDEYTRALQEIKLYKSNLSQTLSVGYLLALANDFFMRACEQFAQKHGETKLLINLYDVEEMIKAVKSEAIDFGLTIISSGDDIDQDLTFKPLYNNSYGIVVKQSDELANFESISIGQLNGKTVLIPNEQSLPRLSYATRRALDSFAASDLHIEDDMKDIGSISPYALTSPGIPVTVSSVKSVLEEPLIFVPFNDCAEYTIVGAIWKKTTCNSSIDLFMECIENNLADFEALS